MRVVGRHSVVDSQGMEGGKGDYTCAVDVYSYQQMDLWSLLSMQTLCSAQVRHTQVLRGVHPGVNICISSG